MELSERSFVLIQAACLFCGVKWSGFQQGDSFEEEHTVSTASRAFHWKIGTVVCEPPLGLKGASLHISKSAEGTSTFFRKAEAAFLVHSLELLDDCKEALAIVIVPESVLISNSRSEVTLRRSLVAEQGYDLLAVISLPTGIYYPWSAVKCSIVVARRVVSPDRKVAGRPVWFGEVKISGPNSSGAVMQIDALLRDWEAYRDSAFTAPPGVPSLSHVVDDSQQPKSWYATNQQLNSKLATDRGYPLNVDYWKPSVESTIEPVDPVAALHAAISLESEILKSLHDLLTEINSPEHKP